MCIARTTPDRLMPDARPRALGTVPIRAFPAPACSSGDGGARIAEALDRRLVRT